MKTLLNRYFLMSLTSAWCIGIGLRFILMDVEKEMYIPGVFDKFFDWGGLCLLGIILLMFMIYDIYKRDKYNEWRKHNTYDNRV